LTKDGKRKRKFAKIALVLTSVGIWEEPENLKNSFKRKDEIP